MLEEKKIDSDIEEDFIKLAEQSKSFDFLSRYICPHLVGEEFELVRNATLLLQVTEYDVHTRLRLHELLIGPAGTGKTDFLIWFREHMQGIMINAEMTSKTGLVGDARGGNITPGVLADYDGNLIMIDELDKMTSKDQNGLLQAMEEGEYMIVKGKKRRRFRAEIRIIASANELGKISRPLLDRFDFVFNITIPSREERARYVPRIVKSFFGHTQEQEVAVLKTYLQWIKDYHPIQEKDDDETIEEMITAYIKGTHTDIDEISHRNLEYSILRIATAMAKLDKKNVTAKYTKKAIMFKDKMLNGIVI